MDHPINVPFYRQATHTTPDGLYTFISISKSGLRDIDLDIGTILSSTMSC